MAEERPVVNVTPGTPIKSSAQSDAERTVRVNTGGIGELLSHDPAFAGASGLPEGFTTEDESGPQPPDPRGGRFAGIEMSDDEVEARRRIEEIMKLPPEQRSARLATVLDRGVVFDRLKVDLPPDLYGEWVRNDPLEIDRMQTLGFWVDNTYASRRSLHSDGSSANIVADVIHMCTMRVNKEMIDQIYLEKQVRSTRHPKHAIEDDEFVDKVRRETGEDIPAFSESKMTPVNINDVRAALSKANAQTAVQR